MARTITLTTDFGVSSPYVAAMKGVILSLHPAANIVDLTHAVPPQDVRHGAVVLADTTRFFPPDTIHVAVVDPGVGTERALVYARIGEQHYLAPDNGLLSLLARNATPEKIVRLERREHWLPNVSTTFHGRDILAPVAARLSLGLDCHALGPAQTDLVRLDWSSATVESRRILGAVWFVDSFGNLSTNVTAEMLTDKPLDSATVRCNGQATRGIARTYGERAAGELIALVGSSGRLELAVVDGSAATKTGATVGTAVEVAW